MKPRPTIYTIAQMADVSISTVSRVINRTFAGEQEILERVQSAIRKTGYVPRPEARRLVGKQIESRIIAVFAPFFMHPFFIEVLKGVYKCLHEHNYSINLYDVYTRELKKAAIRKVIDEGLVDGLMLVNMHVNAQEHQAISERMPLVLVAADSELADCVMVDHYGGVVEGVEYLYGLGHRTVAFVNNENEIHESTSRESAFRHTAEKLGMQYVLDYRAVDRRSGYLAAKTLLGHRRDLSCLFFYSDLMAYGGVDYVNEHQLQDRVSVIGFDGFEMTYHMGLATIAQPMEEMGATGAQMLLRKMRDTHARREHIVLDTKLVKGKTCKAVKR